MTNENPKSNNLENRDRKMELMQERHQNAVTALELERILAEEQPLTDYPNSRSPENVEVLRKVSVKLQPILDRLEKVGLLSKKGAIEELAKKYIVAKLTAQRAEFHLKEEIEAEGKESTTEEMGVRLFEMITWSRPIDKVEAVRREGYFVLVLYGDDDYLKFRGVPKDESVGRFHRAMRFPNMSVDVILIRRGWREGIIAHERQHFINISIFNDFQGFEQQVPAKTEYPLISGKIYKKAYGLEDVDKGLELFKPVRGSLDKVKDELLARVRDGGDEEWATNFFTDDLYKYLRTDFLGDEQKEVIKLLQEIRSELKSAYLYLSYPKDARGILVYHLIDIPLIRFPERIRAVVDYYKTRIDEFAQYIPGVKYFGATKRSDYIAELRMEIEGEYFVATELILGTRKSENPEQELAIIRDKLMLLRKRFDELAKED